MFDSRSCGLTAMLLFLALPVAGPRGLQTTGRTADKDALRFEIFEDRDKEFRWRLKHGEEIIGTSGQGYKAKESCKKGIEAVKKELENDKAKFEVYEDTAKAFRWRLKAINGQLIAASSKGYKEKGDCEKVVDAIKKGIVRAEVEEVK
jgi:uncharacterized protein YegP (UPF0339 family)